MAFLVVVGLFGMVRYIIILISTTLKNVGVPFGRARSWRGDIGLHDEDTLSEIVSLNLMLRGGWQKLNTYAPHGD